MLVRGVRLGAITLLAVGVFGWPTATYAADYILPGTGSSWPHAFQWTALSAPDGIAHTDYYVLETMPVFGPQVWTEEPATIVFAAICRAHATVNGPLTKCVTPMADRGARYCARPCNAGAGCGACYEEPTSELMPACHEPNGDITVYAGLAKPPAQCL